MNKPTVIVQIHKGQYLDCLFSGDVRVLIVDEGCARDRFYQLSEASTDAEITEVIGNSTIGHQDDGRLTENERQGIIAAAARHQGETLRVIQKVEDPE